MGNSLSCCGSLPNVASQFDAPPPASQQLPPTPSDPDAPPTTGQKLNTTEFLERIIVTALNTQCRDSFIPIRKVINRQDLGPVTTPPPTGYIQANANFLSDSNLTDNLVHYIIRNLFDGDAALTPNLWVMLAQNINYAKSLTCTRTKLLQLCFLSHISKMLPKLESGIQVSRHIQLVDMDLPQDHGIYVFIDAAVQNPDVHIMIPPNFVQPRIILFRIVTTIRLNFDFRGFVLDGNFIAIDQRRLVNYNDQADPLNSMFVNNNCFHLTIHAASRQHHSMFGIHNPINEDEVGCAGELALWGIVPNWYSPRLAHQAETLARALIDQFTNQHTLVLSPEQKKRLFVEVGIDTYVASFGGMIVCRKRTIM